MTNASLTPTPRASRGRRLSGWLLSPRGQLALAGLLFGLSELLAIPILVVALVVMPYRGGPPAFQAAPGLFWTCLAAAIAVPLVGALFFYYKVSQAMQRLPSRARPAAER